jgi:N-dimethylarginine dimethylaminohydrolase
MPRKQRILLCPPTYFEVSYVINPWMEAGLGQTESNLAAEQWQHLRDTLTSYADIALQEPQPGLPDLVFTANAGLVLGDKVIVSRFRMPERQGEEVHDAALFRELGFTLAPWPQDVAFEGAGDALLDRGTQIIWIGHGFRSDARAPALIEKTFGRQTIPLRLINPRFYHLDTCFCPLADGWLLYYPAAFDAASRTLIETHVPAGKRIAVSDEDAEQYACNAIDLKNRVIMNSASDDLQQRLHAAGFTPVIVPVTEYLKSGGGIKCLTLKLVED